MTPTITPRLRIWKLRVYDTARPERWGWACLACPATADCTGHAIDQPSALAAGHAHLRSAHPPARRGMPTPTRWRAVMRTAR